MDEWIKKMWYIHTMKYYTALKRRKFCLCDNIDEPGRHYAKWKKPVTHGKMLYEPIYIKYIK